MKFSLTSKPKNSPPAIIAVCGQKNAGKTTLICALVPILKNVGLSVAVVKHDGHDFTPDVPGTDSFRFSRSGALGVGVYSAFRYMVAVQREKTTFEQMALFFSWADLIILEGGKTTDYPKIEVVRAQISKGPDLKIDNRLLTATDLAGEPHWGRLVGLDDHYAIAAAIEDYLLRSWRGD